MLAFLLAAGPVAAARNLIPFTLTLSDQSPLISFSPDGSAGLQPRWSSSFTKSPWSTYTDGQAGMGDSWHWINTSMTLESNIICGFGVDLEASDIIVMGTKNGSPPPDGAIDAAIEGYSDKGESTSTDVPASDGIKLSSGQLARVSNLDAHRSLSVNFTIRDKAASMYNVQKIMVTTALWSEAESFDSVPISTVRFVVDGAPNPVFKYSGPAWNVSTSTIYDDTVAHNVTEIFCPQGNESDSSLTINVPQHTAYILINGTVGPGRYYPTYHWSPAPPGVSSRNRLGGNATSPWLSGQPLYVQRLDPDTSYTLEVKRATLGDVYLHTVSFYSGNLAASNGTVSGTSKSSTGAIAGGVVGGVVGALLLGSLVFYFCFWRPRKQRDREQEAALSRDNAGFVPFGRETPEPTFVQETDAGAAVLPPQYNPQWDPTGTSTGTTSSRLTTSEKTPLGLPAGSGPNSAITQTSQFAPWKEPYATGAYAGAGGQPEATPPSTLGPVADYKVPFLAGLPAGVAAASPNGQRGSTEKLIPVSESASRPLPRPPL